VKALRIHEAARREANLATVWYAERRMGPPAAFGGVEMGISVVAVAGLPIRQP